MSNNNDDNFVPQRQSFSLASSMNIMPQHLDIQAVVSTLSNASNVSLVKKTIQIFRNKYNSALDRSTLDTIEKLMIQQKHGLNVQIELIEVQRQYILALAKLHTVKDDLEIEKRRKRVELKQLEFEEARLDHEIKNLGNPPAREGSKQEEELRRMRENLRHEQEKEREQAKARAEGAAEMDRAKREALRELADDFKAEHGEDMFNWPRNVMEDFQNQKEDIEDTFRCRG